MPKNKLFAISIIVIIVVGVATILFNNVFLKVPPKSERDTAISRAKNLYLDMSKSGFDFSTGPCLSNDIYPNWVADLVHYPREKSDDLSINQCSAYREGRAKHLVELDLKGNLVRAE